MLPKVKMTAKAIGAKMTNQDCGRGVGVRGWAAPIRGRGRKVAGGRCKCCQTGVTTPAAHREVENHADAHADEEADETLQARERLTFGAHRGASRGGAEVRRL